MEDRWRVERVISGRTRQGGLDRVIASLAERQHGVLARAQLLDAGADRYAIDHRLSRGRLHIIHRGVYAAGHANLTPDGRRMAATLAAGGPASHRAAGAHWLLQPSAYLEVTARTHRRHPGIRVHRSRLHPDEITTERGVPVTTVSRTLLDLATVVPRSQVARALNEAEIRRLGNTPSLPELLERHRGRPGTATISAILKSRVPVLRSELESRFLEFVRATGLPQPETNAHLLVDGQWLECDCLWRTPRVVVELDGHAFHATPAAFERDRARDRRLHAAGWRTVRITWQQLQDQAQALAEDLRTILCRPAL
jgi:putative AbiEi antitoxin of type IV toxin-antitoxin system/uncharacterized protein DUF559